MRLASVYKEYPITCKENKKNNDVSYEERLRALNVFSLEKTLERGYDLNLQIPYW